MELVRGEISTISGRFLSTPRHDLFGTAYVCHRTADQLVVDWRSM